MTPPEEERFRRFNDTLINPIWLSLHLTADPRSNEIERFAAELARMAPRIRWTPDGAYAGDLPGLWIGPRMLYRGVPAGGEIDPFLQALSHLDSVPATVALEVKNRLDGLHPPVDLHVYVAPACHHCPGVLAQLVPLAFGLHAVHLTVIDTTMFPEQAQRESVRSVPTIVLDRQFRWTGAFPMSEFVDAVTRRDPALLGKDTLERMILDGGAYELAAMMNAAGKVFPSLYRIVIDPNLNVRLAAMVTFEDLIERNRPLAAEAVGPLLKCFPSAIDTVKGDLLYLLGQIGSETALPLMRAVEEGLYPEEVKEAAREAMEKIVRQ